ncbi:MAG: hypothetical protein N4A49_09690 [Marinifilaceae bacterium]|jgi:hypothetical protein|nr:hypothetical protein [Marinifilaceae bacterium]
MESQEKWEQRQKQLEEQEQLEQEVGRKVNLKRKLEETRILNNEVQAQKKNLNKSEKKQLEKQQIKQKEQNKSVLQLRQNEIQTIKDGIKILNIPIKGQMTTGDCLKTCVEIISKFYEELKPLDINKFKDMNETGGELLCILGYKLENTDFKFVYMSKSLFPDLPNTSSLLLKEQNIKNLLDAGYPVIVHNDNQGGKHATLIIGYTDDHFLILDPGHHSIVAYKNQNTRSPYQQNDQMLNILNEIGVQNINYKLLGRSNNLGIQGRGIFNKGSAKQIIEGAKPWAEFKACIQLLSYSFIIDKFGREAGAIVDEAYKMKIDEDINPKDESEKN